MKIAFIRMLLVLILQMIRINASNETVVTVTCIANASREENTNYHIKLIIMTNNINENNLMVNIIMITMTG